MSTGTVKYEPRQGKSPIEAGSVKKSIFSKVSPAALLSAEDRDLLRVTLEARDEWMDTNANFDYVHEDMLVDYYTYKLKACEARYTYFLKLVKEKGLSRYI
jgi:hypothetical protein